MVAEVDPKKVPLPTDPGGIVSITCQGADGNYYTFTGSGSIRRTVTQQQEKGSKKMLDVTYVEVLLVPDPSKHNATLPVTPAPRASDDG